jgi:RNA polymerase sigma factor (sigma-70 family)
MATVNAEAVVRQIRHLVGAPGTDALTDRSLLQRFTTAGDEGAFVALVARHGPMVLRVCRHVLGNAHDAEDAFQATFLVLARKAAGLRGHESVASWLYEVASRVAHKARTAAHRRRLHEARAGGPLEPAAPVGEITLREAQAVLTEELGRLPERFRTPLVLCYLEGLTQDQGAQQAGWAIRTFKRRLWQGKDLLQRRLQRRGVTLAAVLSASLLSDSELTSAALLGAATRSALAFRQGLTAGAESSRAIALAEAFLRTLFLHRLRIAGTLLLVALAIGALSARTLTHPALPPAGQGDGSRSAPVGASEPVSLGTFGWHFGLRGVAVSPDGKTLASTGNDGLVKLWDLDTRTELRTFPPVQDPRLHEAHEGPADCVAFSPDGHTLASGGVDCTIRLWDVRTGKNKGALNGHTIFVSALAFSPDGTMLASTSGGQPLAFETIESFRDPRTQQNAPVRGEVKVWDLATGTDRTFFREDTGRITSVVFSPDGKTLVSAGWDGALRRWDPRTGKERACVREAGRVICAAFSPDGKTLASVSTPDPTARTAAGHPPEPSWHPVTLWDPATGRVRGRLGGQEGRVSAVAFSPDGRIVATASDHPGSGDWRETGSGRIRLWNTSTFRPLGAPLTCPHSGAVVAFGAGGKILVAAGPGSRSRGEITLWALHPPGDGR